MVSRYHTDTNTSMSYYLSVSLMLCCPYWLDAITTLMFAATHWEPNQAASLLGSFIQKKKKKINLPFCFQDTALFVNHSDIKKSLSSCFVVVIHLNHFPLLSSLLPLFIISSTLSLPSSLSLCVDSESFAEEMQVHGAPISQKEEPKCFTNHCNKMWLLKAN